MSIARPESVTGGCLCGGVRYKVNFSKDHDWNKGPHTCQCTQCRKNSGTLVYYFHSVAVSEIIWQSKSTYAEYTSSPGCVRAFCKNCGSPLGWIDAKVNMAIDLAVGTIDEEFFIGDRDGDDRPIGAYGIALANPKGDHFYLRNEIEGVTNVVSAIGAKYWKATEEGPM